MKKVILFLLNILIVFSLSAQSLLPSWQTPPESEEILVHDGFTVSYNHSTLTPNWSAWDITPEHLAKAVTGRTDFFTVDPAVKDGPQAEYRDYSNNGLNLDRGHMTPSADFTWDRTANEQTFYLTNICPQDHTLNEGLWLELEQRCRAWAKRYKTNVHIVCGPIHEDNPNTIGKNNVWVPAAFFKVVTMAVDGKFYSIAFIFPNKPIGIQEDIFNYAVPLNEVRKKTGLSVSWAKGNGSHSKDYPWDISWKKPKSK